MARAVVFHEAELRELLTSEQGPVAQELMRRGRRVQNRAKDLVHVDTGRLKGSITLTMGMFEGSLAAIISTNVEYAIHHEHQFPFLEPALAAAF